MPWVSRGSPPLSGWFVVSLRPVGEHGRLLRVARSCGAATLSLPGLRLAAREDTPTRAALDDALACDRVVFTSPAAVRSAARLRGLALRGSDVAARCVFALGTTTRAALLRAGIADAIVPVEATSEGLLALAALAPPLGRVGLVTAPGGRGIIEGALRARGATLVVADVYERMPARLGPAHATRLLAARGHGAACITSAEALANVLVRLPGAARATLLGCVAITSSARLEAIARAAGFATVLRAAGPSPRALLDALRAHAAGRGFR